MKKPVHTLLDEQTLAEAVARAVEDAETRHPGPGTGAVKRTEVVDALVGMLPFNGPCAPFLRSLTRLVVGLLVEIAVAAFQRKWKEAAASGGRA